MTTCSPGWPSRDLQVRFGDRRVVQIGEFTLGEAEIVGLAGESGSGKSMTTLAILGLAHTVGATVSGSIRLDGTELTGLSQRELRELRGRQIAAIFQSPAHGVQPGVPGRPGGARRAAAARDEQGGGGRRRPPGPCGRCCSPPELLDRYPAQLSGGQLQRVAIALALALRAEVLLADEPTSALDVTVQAEVLELLRELREREGMSVLLISHDLAVVAELCDRVAIMQDGRIVEQGPAAQVLCGTAAPLHGRAAGRGAPDHRRRDRDHRDGRAGAARPGRPARRSGSPSRRARCWRSATCRCGSARSGRLTG